MCARIRNIFQHFSRTRSTPSILIIAKPTKKLRIVLIYLFSTVAGLAIPYYHPTVRLKVEYFLLPGRRFFQFLIIMNYFLIKIKIKINQNFLKAKIVYNDNFPCVRSIRTHDWWRNVIKTAWNRGIWLHDEKWNKVPNDLSLIWKHDQKISCQKEIPIQTVIYYSLLWLLSIREKKLEIKYFKVEFYYFESFQILDLILEKNRLYLC